MVTVRLLVGAVVTLLLLAACGSGDDPLPGDGGSTVLGELSDGEGMAGMEEGNTPGVGGHVAAAPHHTIREVGGGSEPPGVALEVVEDPVEGWNLRVTLSNFRLAPERVSTAHVPGEGHLHLYVDGRKVSRIYGEWHHIGELESGEHELRVDLSSNDHSLLAVDGDIIHATATVVVDEGRSSRMAYGHAEARPAAEPYPQVSLKIVDDPAGGWNLHVVPIGFRLAPQNASGHHAEGEGHMHLYIDGEKVARLYETWYQLPPLEAGTYEIRVDLRSNDHAPLTAEGAMVAAVATLEVPMEEATATGEVGVSEHGTADQGHAHGDTGDDGIAGVHAPVRAEVSDADETVSVRIVGGEPVGGARRVRLALGSVVALAVTSDAAEQVHVHGYDIFEPVAEGRPARFAFVADIPGVFEVELEGSGLLLLQLEIA